MGACSVQTRNNEEASVAGPEWEVKRAVGENRGILKWSKQIGQGSPGHGKNLGFNSRWNGKILEGFELKNGMT